MNRTIRQHALVIASTFFMTWNVGIPAALSQNQPAALPAVAPKADQLLRQMSQTLKAAKAFSFQADITTDTVNSAGQKLQYEASGTMVVSRPNRLQAQVRGDRRNLNFYYDGNTFALLNPEKKLYTTLQAPNNLDALLDLLADRYNLVLPLGDFVYSDPYTGFTGQILQGSYVGLHSVNGQKCHHLAFRQEDIDWQLWVQDSPQALPCKLVIDYKQDPGSPQYVAVFSKWNMNLSTPPEGQFTFTPPPEARRVEFVPSVAEQIQPLSRE